MVEARVELASRSQSRLRLLDLLRLVAALGVVAYHYTARQNPAWGTDEPARLWSPLSSVTAYGSLGVQLFFLISGFVVLMSAIGADVPRFVASRVSRLFPAYWVAVLATGALLFLDRSITLGGNWEGLGVPGVLVNLTMMQQAFGVPHVDGVYWTLWVELKFYVILGVFLLVGITRQRILALAVVWPVAAALLAGAQIPIADELLMPSYAPFFATGMLLFLVYREGWSLVSALALLLNWTLLVRLAFTDGVKFVSDNTAVGSSPYLVAAVFTAFVVGIALVTQTRLALVNWKWLTLAGALTYPVYLLHEVWGWWLISKLAPVLPKTVVLALVVGIMLVAAYLLHRLVERPLGPALRRRLEAGLRFPPALRRPAGASPAPAPAPAPAAEAPAGAGADRPYAAQPERVPSA
ncbi:acyltransferase family protein [Naasia aerilata]|uniref:Acyltransferase 3 domain-containing protein n=1 Tax=Naasia aerilata TaxID=1162966 RepID=A0ABN6XLY9_9MICO|nr:acyltransferase [Naasia aerilata]BDZ45911.1 hypothetical protein GCM10025866_18200 [Naasia aerilata]